MDRLASILVGIDFSDSSRTALAQAIRIAGWNRAKLHAIHVIDTVVAVEIEKALSPLVQGIQDAMIQDARKAWAQFASELPGKGEVGFDVAINNQLIEMLNQVRARAADLLVLGAVGHATDQSVGPYAAELLRRAPCPVLLVREGQAGSFKKVIACVDFSETSRRAVDAAARVVAQDGGTLAVVHVAQPPWSQFNYRAPAAAADPAFREKYHDTLRQRLEDFCKPEAPETRWAKPTYHVLEARSHGSAIIEFAARTGADLVVLGTRGRTNLREVLLGTTAERIIRGAPCCILAVKPS